MDRYAQPLRLHCILRKINKKELSCEMASTTKADLRQIFVTENAGVATVNILEYYRPYEKEVLTPSSSLWVARNWTSRSHHDRRHCGQVQCDDPVLAHTDGIRAATHWSGAF